MLVLLLLLLLLSVPKVLDVLEARPRSANKGTYFVHRSRVHDLKDTAFRYVSGTIFDCCG